ncbi:MAG: phospholipase C [Acidimicrobiales bacterium]
MSRRSLLQATLAVGVAGGIGRALGSRQGRLIDAALAAGSKGAARLGDIEHVVILVQENRSFDHYFGSYRGVAGFSDPSVLTQPGHGGKPVWYQYGWGPGDAAADPEHYLLPFHLDTSKLTTDAACVDDPVHAWVPQHQSYDGGRMDGFVSSHIAANGTVIGPTTMGYYNRQDIGFYYALADAFTICDHYHCSVLGPTTPNRLYTVSATLDPDGTGGGPVTSNPGGYTPLAPSLGGGASFTWTTMADALEAAGVSWKAYQVPGSQLVGQATDNVLLYFKQFQDPTSKMFEKGVAPTFPGGFQADVAAGTLPAVSWIMSMSPLDEHPPAPTIAGDLSITQQVLATLLSNPSVWERTVLFVTYDENGGFFDHVPPPTAPPGTAGEYLTVPPTIGGDIGPDGPVTGPIGLGFRVPLLVLSPLSAGGFVCSDTFDHTSLLRFVETRWGVPVPNLSTWRRSVTGDLTSAINFAGGMGTTLQSVDALVADAGSVATLATAGGLVATAAECPAAIPGAEGVGSPTGYPVPKQQTLPTQEPGSPRRPSGPV